MKKIDLAKEFSPILRNRNKNQTDGKFTAIDFRNDFLSEQMKEEWWSNDKKIEIDLTDVDTLGPSWVNEAFAFFMTYGITKERFFEKFLFKEMDEVWQEIIETEIEDGYNGDS